MLHCSLFTKPLYVAGALLSQFVEPIYFNSIILGSLYHRDHMSRAMWARLTSLESLPTMYRFNRPLLSSITSPESRQPGKAPNFSANWLCCDDSLEVVTASSGKTEQGTPSRLCKHTMFELYCKLKDRLTPMQKMMLRGRLYGEAKETALQYQHAKNSLIKAFEKSGLGTWVRKPAEQDLFELNSMEADQ